MNRRSFLQILGLAPLAPLAAKLTPILPKPRLTDATSQYCIDLNASNSFCTALTDEDMLRLMPSIHYPVGRPPLKWRKT